LDTTDAVLAAERPRDDAVYLRAKRIFDVSVTVAALVVVIPIVAIAAMAIRLGSRGPMFYAHERCGQHGVPFRCWKLRTMIGAADQRLDPDVEAAFRRDYKLERDPRITRIGMILRRTSVDELPQLWNVMRGDMSLVGPRPVTRAEFDGLYGSQATAVFRRKPGLTGLWQVSGRSQLTYRERIELDLAYADKASFWLDLWILRRTPAAVVSLRGAR
jgi:lipopolysaccharide/colanic/teichoic acid biosynthesis glycosyltransferase